MAREKQDGEIRQVHGVVVVDTDDSRVRMCIAESVSSNRIVVDGHCKSLLLTPAEARYVALKLIDLADRIETRGA